MFWDSVPHTVQHSHVSPTRPCPRAKDNALAPPSSSCVRTLRACSACSVLAMSPIKPQPVPIPMPRARAAPSALGYLFCCPREPQPPWPPQSHMSMLCPDILRGIQLGWKVTWRSSKASGCFLSPFLTGEYWSIPLTLMVGLPVLVGPWVSLLLLVC